MDVATSHFTSSAFAVLDQPKGLEDAWQDVEWAEFEDPETCRIAWLPLKAREHQQRQREIAKEKGKQVAGNVLGHSKKKARHRTATSGHLMPELV